MKQVLERNFLDEIHTKPVIGYPMSPAHWVGEPEYRTVTALTMTTGNGIGGSQWKEIVEKLNPLRLSDTLATGHMVHTKTFRGKPITLNPRFIVKAEDFTMVTRVLHSDNGNFTIGDYTCRWLLPLDESVEFINRF